MGSTSLSSVDSVVSVVHLSLAFPSNKTGHHTKKLFTHRRSRTEKAATSNKQGYSLNNPGSTLHKIEFDRDKILNILEISVLLSLVSTRNDLNQSKLKCWFHCKTSFFINPANHKYCKIWKNLAFNKQESKISVSK